MATLRRDENTAPGDRSINESISSQRRSSACPSPYSCKVPVCSSASSSEEGEEEEKENKRERRRNRVKEEILATEETYQHHLSLIVKYFEQPLRDNGLIPAHVIVTIFSNLHQIIAINTELSGHLRSLSIGRAFLHLAPFLKLYSTYANNHERALATLMEWEQKCPDLSTFRRSQEESPEMGGLKLNALLITPVQRIPRYKLLLQELLQFTPKDDEDYKNIEDASLHIGEVAQHINEHIKQQDNFNKMLAIQKALAGPVAPKILTPGRIFIKDGRLKKVSKKHGRSLERMFFLFSDILMYAKPRLLESQHQYQCCCVMPLQHCMVARVFGGNTKSQGALFTITCKTESLLLYSDQKTVDSWISTLTKAIGQLVKNRQSLRKESSAKTPLRKAALAKLHRMEKMEDPLQAAMRKNSPQNSPNKAQKKSTSSTSSPLRSLSSGDSSMHVGCLSPRKRLMGDFPRLHMGCLSPRSRLRSKKKKGSEEDDEVPVYEGSESEKNTHVPLTPPPTEAPRRSLSVGPRTRSMSWAAPKHPHSPLLLPPTHSPLPASSSTLHGTQSPQHDPSMPNDIQRFIHDDEEEDDEMELDSEVDRDSSGMSLTESDLLSLFTAADAMESGFLQSHLYSMSDSSCSQTSSLSHIPEFSAPPSPVPSTSGSVYPASLGPSATGLTPSSSSLGPSATGLTPSSSDPYDYNNYAPSFANKYRTPMKMTPRRDSIDSVFEDGPEFSGEQRDSPVKKRRSYLTATHVSQDQAEGVLLEDAEQKTKESDPDTESTTSKRNRQGGMRALKEQLPSLDKAMDVASSALDAATTLSHSAPGCSLQ